MSKILLRSAGAFVSKARLDRHVRYQRLSKLKWNSVEQISPTTKPRQPLPNSLVRITGL